MEIVAIWVIASLVVGWAGSEKTIGFWGAFILSLVISPIFGFIVILFYPSKVHRDNMIYEQQRQTQILQQMNASKISHADEIEKLKKQLDSGAITDEEFTILKSKIINS